MLRRARARCQRFAPLPRMSLAGEIEGAPNNSPKNRLKSTAFCSGFKFAMPLPFPLDDGNALTQTGGRFTADFPLPALINFAYKIAPTPGERQPQYHHGVSRKDAPARAVLRDERHRSAGGGGDWSERSF
jgi:hypothetical protein